tara:strand:- start:2 stop:166 length:165 start_codon:yes stop_codon:yes gene_type:complete
MKRFKVQGWYKLNYEKHFKFEILNAKTTSKALNIFLFYYEEFYFYKTTVEEIVL